MMENHSFKVDKTRVDAGLVSAYNVQIPARIEGYTPLDPSYALHTTPVNKRFRTFPSMVVYPKTAEEVADIVKAVHTATSSTSASDQSHNESPIRIVVRSGGHNYAAFSSGFEETSEAQEKDAGRADGMGKGVHPVIVIDLKHFDTIEYDEQSQIATIGSGTRLGKVSEELYKRGRALPHGVCPNVGIGGHVLHGGHGFTSRAWGLAMDRIVEMQVVLADGSIVTASNNDDKHKDLFWAMRGAGPSFGVALSFKLLTFSAPPTNVFFLYEWDAVRTSDATNAFLEYQKWLPDVPAELSTGFMFCRGEKKGYVHVWFSGQYLGPIGSFHATVAPFFGQLEPYLDFSHIKQGQKLNPKHAGQDPSFKVEECTFERALFYLGDGTGDSDTFYATSLSVPEGGELTEGQVRALLAHLLESTRAYTIDINSPLFSIDFYVGGDRYYLL
ncbi:hypothetical protein FS842_001785 [Serendipita sp. 407]|nr:hypothetical protein FS842_001785 [Serendipita sp. 407]